MIYIYIIIALAFSALFSGFEIAFLSSDKLRLQIDRNRGGINGKILDFFYSRPNNFVTTLLVGNNIALVIYGLFIAKLLEPWLQSVLHNDMLVLLVQSLISTVIILITGEYIPKASFKKNANGAIRLFAPFIFLLYIILFPVTLFFSLLSSFILFIMGQKRISTDITPTLSTVDLEHYLSQNMPEESNSNVLGTEVKIMQNVIEFPSLQIRDCMIPRNEIIAVELATPRAELEQLFTSTGLSKIIVYQETIDQIIGYIHSNETFKKDTWQKHIVPAIYVPESMLAAKLMRQLMQKKRSIAIVIDELGGTAGLVTLEDVVEEIFGDIEDEHDTNKYVAKQLDEETYILSGRMEIDDINEQFNLSIPESDDYQTIAGFILNHYPNIPQKGETLIINQYKFEILRSSSTKIELVKMKVLEI
ncbi:hemolysin [Porphyromonas macacae]|uniref:Hemolysin n=1 Tax=Porphyromonas macacae TaxID=28115 RepID=A0A0A2E6E7_9PORP|nr:hemolysin family protein [Porphyromonas macacae]KGN74421.1 hemolysin [Porphyromonas macacae]KGO00599.1 hemolysin [Porphyromonas macacae]SUB77704.1 Putative Mg2+ and Co2+ transporter CorB [Porphyromonas macacae]